MLTAEEIASWDSPPSYTVTEDGMIVNKDGEAILTIQPDAFPDAILRMSAVLRGRRDLGGNLSAETVIADTAEAK